MEEKQSIDQHIFESKHKDITEKDHEWTDQELYPETDEQLSCWQSFKKWLNNFANRSIDYLEFDRIFFLEGEQKIDLKKCHKKFLQEYLQTYSQRQLKFGYSFDYVLEQKIKQEKRKEKNFCREWYRFICCEGGNEMNQIDYYYKSERQFQQLLKKKIMERKEEYEEQKRKEKEERQKEKQKEQERQKEMSDENIRATASIEILSMKKQQDQSQVNILTQHLQFYEQPIGTKKEKKKKQVEKKIVNTEILQVRNNEKVEENNVFDYQNDYIEQKISGRKEKGKQPSKPTQYSQSNSEQFQFNKEDKSKKNQIALPKGSSSHSVLTPKRDERVNPNNPNNSVLVKNIYKENVITTTTYHENIIKKTREVTQDVQNYQNQEYNQKKTRKTGKRNDDIEMEDEIQEDEVKVSRKKKAQISKKQSNIPQSSPKKQAQPSYYHWNQQVQLQKSPKLQNQSLLFTSPRYEENLTKQMQTNSHKKQSRNNRQVAEQQPQMEQLQNSNSKKKTKKNRIVEQEFQVEQEITSKANRNYDENQVINEANYQTIEEPTAAKAKKQKKNRNTSNTHLQIIQNTYNFESQDNVAHISATQNVEPDVEEYSAAKKKRKQRKQLRNQDQQLTNQIDLNNLVGTSASTVQIPINRYNSQYPGKDEDEGEQFNQAAKKRKVKKQLKEKPSDQTFEMVLLDDLDGNQKVKGIQESANSIVFNDNEDQVETGVKAEKKRKKPKARKQTVQQDLEEVVNIQF